MTRLNCRTTRRCTDCACRRRPCPNWCKRCSSGPACPTRTPGSRPRCWCSAICARTFSHGTKYAPEYMRKILEGKVSPRPEVRVVDGDGGREFIPTHSAAELAIAKAAEVGVGAATPRNHFHFGTGGQRAPHRPASPCRRVTSRLCYWIWPPTCCPTNPNSWSDSPRSSSSPWGSALCGTSWGACWRVSGDSPAPRKGRPFS